MKYVIFIHMFIKHFPKFLFEKDTRMDKSKYQLKEYIQLKVFDSSIIMIIDNTNKKNLVT